MTAEQIALSGLALAHLAMVAWMLHHPRRLGTDAADARRDPLYSSLKAWAAYAPVFAAQAYACLRERTILAWLLPGTAVFAAGYALRIWSIRTLGRLFTMEIGIRGDHRLVESGPYRILRHPSYTGYLLMLAGFGVAARSWIALAVPLAITAVFLTFRIRAEERMLGEALGETYAEYRKRTWRLIPYLF